MSQLKTHIPHQRLKVPHVAMKTRHSQVSIFKMHPTPAKKKNATKKSHTQRNFKKYCYYYVWTWSPKPRGHCSPFPTTSCSIKDKLLNLSEPNGSYYKMVLWCLSVLHHSVVSDPLGCRPPGNSVHRISQARILGWVAVFFSRGSSLIQGSNLCHLHYRWILYHWAIREACNTL